MLNWQTETLDSCCILRFSDVVFISTPSQTGKQNGVLKRWSGSRRGCTQGAPSHDSDLGSLIVATTKKVNMPSGKKSRLLLSLCFSFLSAVCFFSLSWSPSLQSSHPESFHLASHLSKHSVIEHVGTQNGAQLNLPCLFSLFSVYLLS